MTFEKANLELPTEKEANAESMAEAPKAEKEEEKIIEESQIPDAEDTTESPAVEESEKIVVDSAQPEDAAIAESSSPKTEIENIPASPPSGPQYQNNGAENKDITPAKPKTTGGGGETSLRVHVSLLDQLMNLAGELVLSRNQLLQTIGTEDFRSAETVIGYPGRC